MYNGNNESHARRLPQQNKQHIATYIQKDHPNHSTLAKNTYLSLRGNKQSVSPSREHPQPFAEPK